MTKKHYQHGLLAALLLLAPWPGMAQTSLLPGVNSEKAETEQPAPESDAVLSVEAIQARLASVEAQIESANKVSDEGAEDTVGAGLARVRSNLLTQLNIAQAFNQASNKDGAATTPELPPLPATIFEHNELLELQHNTQQKLEALEKAVDTARETLRREREELEAAERARRELADGAPENAIALARVNARLATEEVNLATLELRQLQQQKSAAEALLEPLAELLEKSRKQQAENTPDASAGFRQLAQREAKIQRQIEDTQRQLANAELRVNSAQQRYTQAGSSDPDQLEVISALRANADSLRQQLALAQEQLARIPQLRENWRQWQQALLESTPTKTLRGWNTAVDTQIDDLENLLVKRRGRIADVQRDIAQIGGRVDAAPAALQRALQKELATLQNTQLALQEDVRLLERALRVKQRLQEQLYDRTSLLDPSEWIARAGSWLHDFWTYELVSVDDEPITTGSLIIALTLALFGLLLSRKMSTWLGGAMGRRTRLDHGAVHAIETLLFYTLLVTFTLLALRTINFPLTAFAFLGGALAIGLGFGSQNIMNNFISGLIIMLERPIRSQDVVVVDGEHGTVQKIGARSTQIRSLDGRNIIVPNSYFLESNVINWTLSDELVRAKVTVGVAYGSPTRLCEKLIQEVMANNKDVIKHPEPLVIFDGFGDNSLNFDVYFWLQGRTPMSIRKVQSEVRFGIDELFAKHDIVIAFPQRDIHFDADTPLSIKMLKNDD